MKSHLRIVPLVAVLSACLAQAQGTFIYDQQSADESIHPEAPAGIQVNAPIGQSFTPSLPAVGFIRLSFSDVNPGNNRGATILLNLPSDSITGPILASTAGVPMPDAFGSLGFATTNFFFPTPIPLTPGTTYFFDISVVSGDAWVVGRFIPTGSYTGGTEYLQGQPGVNDLWFREGVVVPEPSPLGLIAAGGALCVWRRNQRQSKL